MSTVDFGDAAERGRPILGLLKIAQTLGPPHGFLVRVSSFTGEPSRNARLTVIRLTPAGVGHRRQGLAPTVVLDMHAEIIT